MLCFSLFYSIQYLNFMDAKTIIYGETAVDRLTQELRASGQPLDLASLTQRYLEILRELVLNDEQQGLNAE